MSDVRRSLTWAMLAWLPLAAAPAPAAPAASEPPTSPVAAPACANFGVVVPGFYRGAEPDADCLAHLAALGVRTVVSLRDDEEAAEREQARAEALGMRFVSLPMSGFGRPSWAEVRRALDLVRAPEHRPVFLHCRRGRDRTGVVVAAHRMTHEGWPVERAMDEAEDFGLAWWQIRMKKFIRDFRADGRLPAATDD
jgi:protein tyrosine phosphatase (PTP) superfamily phosphohydrolase (DUF442 family)